MTKRAEIEDKENWRGLITKAPYLNFPKSWNIQILPPFGGAMLRFRVKRDKAEVSVYMDIDNSLGYYTDKDNNPAPYWEVYPYNENIFRCGVNEIGRLISAIKKSIRDQNK